METLRDEVKGRLERLLDRVHGLPTLPPMLTQMNRLMSNPRTSAREVSQLISSDPSIASRVLRIVNSSFYGFPNRITTITHAIVILGFNTVKSIVLSSSIFDVFRGDARTRGFDRPGFWKHSIACGAASRVLARRLGHVTVEEYFIAGLLHDVGKIVFDQFMHDQFKEVIRLVETKDCLIVQAEEEKLGLTHADAGAWLFQRWNLPKGLIECIQYHHNPSLASENPTAVAMVHIADVLVRALRIGSGGDRKIPPISDAAWNELGLQTDAFDGLLKEVAEEAERAMVFLDFV